MSTIETSPKPELLSDELIDRILDDVHASIFGQECSTVWYQVVDNIRTELKSTSLSQTESTIQKLTDKISSAVLYYHRISLSDFQ